MPRPRTHHLRDVVVDSDLLIALCDEAHEELALAARTRNVLHWSVADPVRIGTDAAFDAALEEISTRVRRAAKAFVLDQELSP